MYRAMILGSRVIAGCLSVKSGFRKGFAATCGIHLIARRMTSQVLDLSHLDATQVKLLEEECILIDNDDQKVGSASKKICHLLKNIDKGMLHRAFSVFLFDREDRLLLQQRASTKITFPDHWTNTCCSHPLCFDAELDEKNSLGVIRAAQRKLKHELGIESHEIPLESFEFLTRIHYRSANVPRDDTWGEHEIDHILFVRQDVTLQPNANEVRDYRYVNKEELNDMIEKSKMNGVMITPWFRLIVDNFLWKWWDNLDSLKACKDTSTIHRMC